MYGIQTTVAEPSLLAEFEKQRILPGCLILIKTTIVNGVTIRKLSSIGNKKPENENDSNQSDTKCTCGKGLEDEHECPYASDINDDHSLCTCCDHCSKECADNI